MATSPAGRPVMHPGFRSSGSDRLKALAAVNSAAEHNGLQQQEELSSQAAGMDPVGALGNTPHRQSFSSSTAVGSPRATGMGFSSYFSTGSGHIGSQLGLSGAMSVPGTGLHHVRVDGGRPMSPGGPCQRPRSAGSNQRELSAFPSTVMTPPAGSGWHPFMRAPQQQLGPGAVGDLLRAGRDGGGAAAACAAEQPGLNASLAALGIFVQDDSAPLTSSRSESGRLACSSICPLWLLLFRIGGHQLGPVRMQLLLLVSAKPLTSYWLLGNQAAGHLLNRGDACRPVHQPEW